MLLCYQVAPRLSLTTCWQIVESQDDNKLLEQLVNKSVELNNLLASCQQAVDNKLGTSSANTSCWQVVGTALLQFCYRFVTTCAFLRVYLKRLNINRLNSLPRPLTSLKVWRHRCPDSLNLKMCTRLVSIDRCFINTIIVDAVKLTPYLYRNYKQNLLNFRYNVLFGVPSNKIFSF
jgi:hypothetical protein